MGNNLVVSGYYGFQNAGDEAVLFSMLRTLRSEQADVKITVLSNDPGKTAKAYGVRAVNRWKLKEVFRALKECDLLISGGGSLLQDATGSKSILYYLGVVLLAKLLRKKVFFYAQGIGPISGRVGQEVTKKIVNMVNLITVRDEASQKLLQELKIDRPPIRVTADAVLGLYAKEMDRSEGKKLLAKFEVAIGEETPPLVGIAVRSWKKLEGYKKVLARLGDELARQGYQVIFLSFHFPDDIAPSREIAKMMEQPATVILDQLGVYEMLGVLGELQLLVGMRLHSLIMAAVMGVPTVGISYDPKVESFMKLVEQPLAGRVETLDYGTLIKEVRNVLENREKIVEQLLNRTAELREEARETGRIALELLKTESGQEQPSKK